MIQYWVRGADCIWRLVRTTLTVWRRTPRAIMGGCKAGAVAGLAGLAGPALPLPPIPVVPTALQLPPDSVGSIPSSVALPPGVFLPSGLLLDTPRSASILPASGIAAPGGNVTNTASPVLVATFVGPTGIGSSGVGTTTPISPADFVAPPTLGGDTPPIPFVPVTTQELPPPPPSQDVAEPGTLALAGMGVLMLAGLRWRRSR